MVRPRFKPLLMLRLMPELGDDDKAGDAGVTSYPMRPYPSPNMSQPQSTIADEEEVEEGGDDGCGKGEGCGAGEATDV